MSTNAPNVILISVDQWPASMLLPSSTSLPAPVTADPCIAPTIRQLAMNGTAFTKAYTACPVCGPSRRSMMTGLTPRSHGCKENIDKPLPDVVTLAQAFRNASYQAYAVGKLHVWPRRARIGFDEVILEEEGRSREDNDVDDYEFFLAEQGYAGKRYAGGMAQNDYMARPWHLPEECHLTNWAARQMCRVIQRRDPTRPAFWYVSFSAPHPPLTPLRDYLEMYRDVALAPPSVGDWAQDVRSLPQALRVLRSYYSITTAAQIEVDLARRAFMALCTHVDHQIRMIIGTLADEGLSQNTIIAFTSDHGEMLGMHGLWGKGVFYERSARIPLIIAPAVAYPGTLKAGARDERLVELRDLMPTLLSMCGVPIPSTVEGFDLTTLERRPLLYGECGYDVCDVRMIRDERYKLIYYPYGNRSQLFDLAEDPNECADLATASRNSEVRQRLTRELICNFTDSDRQQFTEGNEMTGQPEAPEVCSTDPTLGSQRGLRSA